MLLETDLSTQAAKMWNSLPTTVYNSPSLSSFKTIWKHIFLKKASLLVCKAPFLHSLATEWMCVWWGGAVSMMTHVLYGVNMYILFCQKCFKSFYGHCTIETLCIIITLLYYLWLGAHRPLKPSSPLHSFLEAAFFGKHTTSVQNSNLPHEVLWSNVFF